MADTKNINLVAKIGGIEIPESVVREYTSKLQKITSQNPFAIDIKLDDSAQKNLEKQIKTFSDKVYQAMNGGQKKLGKNNFLQNFAVDTKAVVDVTTGELKKLEAVIKDVNGSLKKFSYKPTGSGDMSVVAEDIKNYETYIKKAVDLMKQMESVKRQMTSGKGTHSQDFMQKQYERLNQELQKTYEIIKTNKSAMASFYQQTAPIQQSINDIELQKQSQKAWGEKEGQLKQVNQLLSEYEKGLAKIRNATAEDKQLDSFKRLKEDIRTTKDELDMFFKKYNSSNFSSNEEQRGKFLWAGAEYSRITRDDKNATKMQKESSDLKSYADNLNRILEIRKQIATLEKAEKTAQNTALIENLKKENSELEKQNTLLEKNFQKRTTTTGTKDKATQIKSDYNVKSSTYDYKKTYEEESRLVTELIGKIRELEKAKINQTEVGNKLSTTDRKAVEDRIKGLEREVSAGYQSLSLDESKVKVKNQVAQSDRNVAQEQERVNAGLKASRGIWGKLSNEIGTAIKRVVEYGIAMKVWEGIRTTLREAYNVVEDFDKALTNVQMIVMDTTKTYEENREMVINLSHEYSKLAQELGTTTIKVIEGANEWLN